MKKPEALKYKVFDILSQLAETKNVKAFVIGGYVRDFFLGIANDDIDIVVEGSGIEFAKSFGELVNSKVSYYENYGTAMVRYKGYEIEFVGARKEMYERGSRKPIVENGTLEDDQKRRDFTINAMAFSLNAENFGELIDPFDGLKDLKNGIIRTPLDPDITFSDDPLRMYRAVRFASKLGFNIEHTAYKSIMKNKDRVFILSRERITEEVDKMLTYKSPKKGLSLLYALGLWCFPAPFNPYTIETIERLSNKKLRWFMLCYSYVVSDYSGYMRDLRLPQEYAKYMNRIIHTFRLLYTLPVPTSPLIRCCLDVSKEDTRDALTLNHAFHLALEQYDPEDLSLWHKAVEDMILENEKEYCHFRLCLDGNEMAELSGLSGKPLGDLLKEVKGMIFSGELENTVTSVSGYVQCKRIKNKIQYSNE